MMSEWKEYRLGEALEIKYGKDHKHLAGGPFPLYGSGGIMRHVERPIYNEESILIPRKGTLENLFFVDTPFWAVDTIFWSKINRQKAHPKFLFYLLKTFDLASYNVGSAVPSLTTQVLNEIPISLPPLPTQTAIAEILSSLDDKIELNNAINKNLEDLAQALFKQWFVDFEFPNEEGLPYQSSGGEMVKSELGLIPKGWMVGKLGDFISFTKGKKPKSTTTIKEIGYLPQILIETFDTGKSVFASPEKMVIANESEIIMVMDGASSGRMEVGFSGIIGSTLAKINSKGICNSFIFYFLKLKEDDIKMNTTGAAIPHADKSLIIDYDISLPSKELLNQFDRINSEIWSLISIYKAEKNKLKFLRDTLLPKLISGELEVFEQSKKNDYAEI